MISDNHKSASAIMFSELVIHIFLFTFWFYVFVMEVSPSYFCNVVFGGPVEQKYEFPLRGRSAFRLVE